jgi:hypothetical protein
MSQNNSSLRIFRPSPDNNRSHLQSMLTRDELSVLRAALVYWSEEMMHNQIPNDPATQDEKHRYQRITPEALELLYNRLAEHNVNYIVVDTLLNHVVNTRLFKFPPRLQPRGGRWQVRSVIG